MKLRIHLFDDGFRPFFLGAAAVGAIHIWLWLSFLSGYGSAPNGWSPVVWHGHELVFGFGAALIAGFMLTAVANWTGGQVASPTVIAGLFLLWLIPRIAMVWPVLPPVIVQLMAAGFFPVLTVLVAIRIIMAGNTRNYVVIIILTALSIAGVMLHVTPSVTVMRAAVDIVLLLMLMIGSRVIPFFTSQRLPEAGVGTSLPLALATMSVTAVAIVSGWLAFTPWFVRAAFAVAALLAFLQWVRWKPWRVAAEPMLWILHLGFAWIIFALVSRAIGLPVSASVHAVTVGALGCLAIGMMTRVALGHTGREIRADMFMVTSFVMVALAALPRLAYPLLPFNAGRFALLTAGALWSLGFLLYFARFAPVMFRARK